ncbi:MAG: glycosyltransferase [Vicinamibacterales bacterium]
MRAAVVVLGDLNRSPRIVLHALALSQSGVDVDLIGFAPAGWTPEGAGSNLDVWPIPTSPDTDDKAGRAGYLRRAVMRGVGLSWHLVRLLLWSVPRPNLILLQNPPGVPTLAVAWLAARVRGARFAIDWHNLTWSMLALRLGRGHPFVAFISAYERWFARRADVNLFVTEAMRAELSRVWGIDGQVFRDQPAHVFQPLADAERQSVKREFLAGLGEVDPEVPLVVTSTSWSADEDFGLLFEALVRYDVTAGASRLLVTITGRGPLRDAFERRIASAGLTHVTVRMLWLEWSDYPRLLAAADLGVCLHRSSSGLDLPMKVLDMFGAGLPVAALDYGPCLGELVVDGRNGLLFRTSDELARVLQKMFGETGPVTLSNLRAAVASDARPSWEEAWRRDAAPALVPKWATAVE